MKTSMTRAIQTVLLTALMALASACGGAGGGSDGLQFGGGTEGGGVIVKLYTEGTISDAEGAPVSGAKVSSTATPEERTTTDDRGHFALGSTLVEQTLGLMVETGSVSDSVEIHDIEKNVVGIALDLAVGEGKVEVKNIDVTLRETTTPVRGSAAQQVLGSADNSLNSIANERGAVNAESTAGSGDFGDNAAYDPNYSDLF